MQSLTVVHGTENKGELSVSLNNEFILSPPWLREHCKVGRRVLKPEEREKISEMPSG